jgi:hypothetical protein
MEVVPFKAEHMRRMALQKAQEGNLAWMAPEHLDLMEGMDSYTLLDGEEVLVCGGVLEMWPGRGVCWTFLSGSIGRRFLRVHGYVKRALETYGYNRLECEVDCRFEQGHRWAKAMGFEVEVPRARNYFPDGSDATLYVKVA